MIAAKARFRAARKVERATGVRIPDAAFHGAFLETVSTLDWRSLDEATRQQLINFSRDFLTCACRDSPLCGCPEREFVTTIIDLRERGLDHRQISGFLLDEYGIDLYPADILSFLEDSVHRLEAIRDVAALQGKEAVAQRAQARIQGIEG